MPIRLRLVIATTALLTGILLATSAQAQTTPRNVAFVHGIGSGGSTWNYAVNRLDDTFLINPRANSYNSNVPISGIASQYGSSLVAQNSVVVAHSMGGLVAREMVRQQGTGRVSALITTGTPHVGASIANAIDAVNDETVINWWIADLSAGWWAYFFYNWPVATTMAQNALGAVVNGIADWRNDLPLLASWDDLKTGSAFVQTLNQGGGTHPYNLPAAHYAIYGAEDFNTMWRLPGAGFITVNYQLQGLYYYMGAYTDYLAGVYYDLWLDTFHFPYFEEYLRFSSASAGFFMGWWSLYYQQQEDWSRWMTFSLTSDDVWYYEDGIVAAWSQAPYFIDQTRYIQALHVNHNEETDTRQGVDAIDLAFRKPDTNVPRPTSPPPPPPPPPPECLIPEPPCEPDIL
jgi:pimeloyl-ACP methyl ester carboxylesterase